MQEIVIVNASHVLADGEVMRTIPAFQKVLDQHFFPTWTTLTRVRLSFVPASIIYSLPGSKWPIAKDAWPIFLNKHSTDDDALGWHTKALKATFPIHGRCFVGDCLRFGLKWTVTLLHELLEIIGDPPATRVFRMANRTLAAHELCDAVEADIQAFLVDGVWMSNWVLPDYFSDKHNLGKGHYDFCGVLDAPCPALSPGGYMEIQPPGHDWKQIQMDHKDGLIGRRAILNVNGSRHNLRFAA